MSDPVVDTPVESKPAEAAPATEAPAAEIAVPVKEEIAPEAAIIPVDPAVVTANLEKAEPVTAPAEASDAPAEETAEATPATAEKPKEVSGLVSFIKKIVPNPKSTAGVKSSGKSVAVETPAKPEGETAPEAAAPAVVEPAEEQPLESGQVEFRTHGGFFGGGWKARTLLFGKEDGYSKEALLPYVGIHKASSVISGAEKTQAAWSNAAHATVTGVGLLFVVKSKALDIPMNIINLADVTDVVVYGSNFTVKTGHSGDYDFGAGTIPKAKAWKAEIETRVEQSKLTHAGVVGNEEYKNALTHYQGQKGHPAKTPDAVTSDEEGAVSGEETKRTNKWSRRISGSLGRLTNPTKESKDKEVASEAAVAPVAETAETPAATEVPVVAETAPEAAATEAPAETAAEPTPAESKKEKRKSFTGFATYFKNKSTKEASPEPTATTEETTEAAAVETAAVESAEPAPVEPVPATEESAPAPDTPSKVSKSKRNSLFGNLLPKKEPKEKTTLLTNGESTEPAATTVEEPAPTSEAVVPPATEETAATTSETKPETAKKDSLSRRLTSQFKSLGRAKSPDKGKSAKVSDEAPKIDTAIESTPDSAPAAESVPAEPLTTTEAPHAPIDSALEQLQSAPVVSTQA